MSPAVLCVRVCSFLRPWRVLALLVLALLVFGPSSLTRPKPAYALTRIPTTTYRQNATWTLAGSPYILDGDVWVSAGVTLTIEPGVVVKFNGQLRSLTVKGTIIAAGTEANRITFTSYKDDSVGGDSNGDGAATTGAPGQYYLFEVSSGNSLSRFAFADIRYGGWGSGNTTYAGLKIGGTTAVTLDHANISSNQYSGLLLTNGASATVTQSVISNNGN